MVSTDHFRQELLAQLGRAATQGRIDVLINSGELCRGRGRPEALDRPAELPENGINDLERDTTVQCFAMNASTVSLNAWGFSNSSP